MDGYLLLCKLTERQFDTVDVYMYIAVRTLIDLSVWGQSVYIMDITPPHPKVSFMSPLDSLPYNRQKRSP